MTVEDVSLKAKKLTPWGKFTKKVGRFATIGKFNISNGFSDEPKLPPQKGTSTRNTIIEQDYGRVQELSKLEEILHTLEKAEESPSMQQELTRNTQAWDSFGSGFEAEHVNFNTNKKLQTQAIEFKHQSITLRLLNALRQKEHNSDGRGIHLTDKLQRREDILDAIQTEKSSLVEYIRFFPLKDIVLLLRFMIKFNKTGEMSDEVQEVVNKFQEEKNMRKINGLII